MGGFRRGRYIARFAGTPADVTAAQRLRYLCFRNAGDPEGIDADRFDDMCLHVLVEDTRDGRVVCCFRLLPFDNGAGIDASYAAQFYGLDALRDYGGRMVEMGRFCIHPQVRDADVLRVAWGAMTEYVDREGVELLFGCSSFKGTEADAYMDAFALLNERHIAPKRWLPRVKAPRVYLFGKRLSLRKPNLKLAMRGMPPLLRTYLVMGGWVSDHAVVDNDLGTMHVFTGLEINAIPSARKRLLRAT